MAERLTEIEHLNLPRIVVSSTTVPEYDHISLVSDAEKARLVELYVCSPGIGLRLLPAIKVEATSEVSPSTSAPEILGVTVKEYAAPGESPVNATLRAV